MARRGFLAAAWVTGAAALAGLGVLWWEHRYDEPFGEPDLTGRVVKVDPPSQPGYFGRGSWHVGVAADGGRRVSLTVRRETPVRGPDGGAGRFAPGQRVRVWRWSETELSNGTLAVQTRFVSIVPEP
ncbi:hypothetical protein [Urbifossiella limnaea]|uniref:Uncharacterized protein n=1 Tax=Urbifossiella limnaea TaxID=2528023 RepID=A0A517XMB0_9BACT|nr:hypothetical protein [Urbifossiella limnaea]QDU18645.1 hypothetical protein ETAA1_05380 [Urbifossiella limnaea]